jgi:hypothetical protein
MAVIGGWTDERSGRPRPPSRLSCDEPKPCLSEVRIETEDLGRIDLLDAEILDRSGFAADERLHVGLA